MAYIDLTFAARCKNQWKYTLSGRCLHFSIFPLASCSQYWLSFLKQSRGSIFTMPSLRCFLQVDKALTTVCKPGFLCNSFCCSFSCSFSFLFPFYFLSSPAPGLICFPFPFSLFSSFSCSFSFSCLFFSFLFPFYFLSSPAPGLISCFFLMFLFLFLFLFFFPFYFLSISFLARRRG